MAPDLLKGAIAGLRAMRSALKVTAAGCAVGALNVVASGKQIMKTNLVMKWEFDAELMDEIIMLRQMRIDHYEKLKADMSETLKTLSAKGVETSQFELKKEIDEKLVELKSRLEVRDSVFADELELYLSLV